MPNLGGPEIIVILLVALIFLGPHRLPEVGRQIGGALRELRRVQSDVRQQLDDALHADESSTTAATSEPGATHDSSPGLTAEGDLDQPPPPTTSFN